MSHKEKPKPFRPDFVVEHEKLVLDIDLSKRKLSGYAELKVVPTQASLNQLALHAKQLQVSRVTVNGVQASKVQWNFLEKMLDADCEFRDLDNLTRHYKTILDTSDQQGEFSIDIPNEVNMVPRGDKGEQFEPLLVRIEYELSEPLGGVYFVLPDARAFPTRAPHVFTTNQPGGARMWFPCVDTLTDACTYEMEFTVDANYLVVSNGELQEQVYNDDETKKTFFFKLATPTITQNIGFAAGPFEVYPDPKIPLLTHFCLPGRTAILANTVSFLHQALNFFEEHLGVPYPYESLKLVFVENAYRPTESVASLIIASTHLLHGADIIDQVYHTRHVLGAAVAAQWFGNFIRMRSWADCWLPVGISEYLTNLFLRKLFGNNEYKFRLIKTNETICSLDVGGRGPLHTSAFIHPYELRSPKLFKKKAGFVLYMLDKKLGSDTFRNMLSKLVTPPTQEGETLEMNISTKYFLSLLKKTTGKDDARAFDRKWISGKGTPTLVCGFWFNRKRHQTEFAVKQDLSLSGKMQLQLLTRINETDGTFDHPMNLDDEYFQTDLVCHSRSRKNRKKRIRYENGEEIEVELSKKNETPLLWLRIDPELEFLRTVVFKQPEFMWIHQLELDRDVFAQYDAIRALRAFPTLSATNSLADFLNNEKAFYRLRMEAAHAVAKLTSKETQFTGMDLLFKAFKSRFYDKEGILVKPNDFSNFPQYFLQKAIPEALSLITNKSSETPGECLEFLLELLKNNDNSQNKFSDYSYLATLLRSLANVNTANANPEKTVKQLNRYLSMDKLMPSYHNEVTVACIQALAELMLRKRIERGLPMLKEFARYGNFEKVRVAAYGAIARLALPDEIDFFLDFLRSDQTNIRHKVVRELTDIISREGNSHLAELQQNNKLMEGLWELITTRITGYDLRLKHCLLEFYRRLWGNTAPACWVEQKAKKRPAEVTPDGNVVHRFASGQEQAFPLEGHVRLEKRPAPAAPRRDKRKIAATVAETEELPKPAPLLKIKLAKSVDMPVAPVAPPAPPPPKLEPLKLRVSLRTTGGATPAAPVAATSPVVSPPNSPMVAAIVGPPEDNVVIRHPSPPRSAEVAGPTSAPAPPPTTPAPASLVAPPAGAASTDTAAPPPPPIVAPPSDGANKSTKFRIKLAGKTLTTSQPPPH